MRGIGQPAVEVEIARWFSVEMPSNGDVRRSVDWNLPLKPATIQPEVKETNYLDPWKFSRAWRIQEKPSDTEAWENTGKFSPEARQVILEAFGLGFLVDSSEFKVQMTSPAELLRIRRKFEQELGQSKLFVFGDGLGDPAPAELYN